jgi:hypothetical protein
MPDNRKLHVRFEGFSESQVYQYPGPGPRTPPPKAQNRAVHGQRILNQLQAVRDQLNLAQEVELPQGIVRDDAIYVEFVSEWGYPLKLDSLEQDRQDPSHTILNIRDELRTVNDIQEARSFVTLMMTEGGVSKFIKKVEEYLTENVTHQGVDTGNPKNSPLVNNIRNIQTATLQSFWTDAPEIPFPDTNEVRWWEVWFSRSNNDAEKIKRVLTNLRGFGVEASTSEIIFAEHRVRLVRGTANQLSQSLLLLDNLAELRKPQEIADFITHKHVSYEDKREWLDDLIKRVEPQFDNNSVLVCILDSGVNNHHPLILPFLPNNHLHSHKPEDWGTYDSWPNGGHGTGVAGLALYGDLVDALADRHQIRILHGVESYKIFQDNNPNDPKLYGSITEEACSTPFVDRPNNLRVFCLTVTAKDLAFKGRPSAWSAAIDKITFDTDGHLINPQLFIVSGGNVIINHPNEHPSKNYLESIHDPAQAYNALTVGAYTRKDRVNQELWPGWRPLSQNGAMSPCNSTSTIWENQWPIKPDIVMEGGNSSANGEFTSDHESLKVLTTDKDYPNDLFLPFGDTSGAAALASKFAAELRTTYPNYWPETIRALMIHSAEWTDAMLEGRVIRELSENDRRNLLRSVGYGVPIKDKAYYSANNSLTLVAERYIQPYKLQGSTLKYNEYHLFSLPWPADILENALFDKDVTLKVTLSYFIEPNPGSRNKRYANNYHYHSHALNFAVIKAGEGLQRFKSRISAYGDDLDENTNRGGEPWLIKRVRNRGSVIKDFITMSGAEMAQRNVLAIYPKNGWYKTRKKVGKGDSVVRYSLIVTLETPENNIDIYTPVYNQIENLITV